MNTFISEEDSKLAKQFLQNGYVIFDLDEIEILAQLREKIYAYACDNISNEKKLSITDYFDSIAEVISVEELNAFRLHIIQKMGNDSDINALIYSLGKKYIDSLVGNELAMQRACNLSIQLPNDDSSLLALHSDVWSGNSPYEVVFWIPLVDCFKTKSMYLLPRNSKYRASLKEDLDKTQTAAEYYRLIESELVWPNISFGKAMLFSHTIPHGNCINEERTTRWTLNMRFKSLLTPYGQKGLGESFLPITTKPVTIIGFEYPSDEWQ